MKLASIFPKFPPRWVLRIELRFQRVCWCRSNGQSAFRGLLCDESLNERNGAALGGIHDDASTLHPLHDFQGAGQFRNLFWIELRGR